MSSILLLYACSFVVSAFVFVTYQKIITPLNLLVTVLPMYLSCYCAVLRAGMRGESALFLGLLLPTLVITYY